MPHRALGILVALLLCQPAFSQTTTQKPDSTQTLITAVNAYLTQVHLMCQKKSNNCVGTTTDPETGESKSIDASKIADTTLGLVRDAQLKHTRGELTGEDLTQFRSNVLTAVRQIRVALVSAMSSTSSGKLKLEKFEAECAANRHTELRLVEDSPQCEECKTVFEEATAICTLYVPWCEPCFAICEGVTIEQFLACQMQWCNGPGPTP